MTKNKKEQNYIWLSLKELEKQSWKQDVLMASLYAMNPPYKKTLCIELGTGVTYCFQESDLLKACNVYDKLMPKEKSKNEK